MTNAGTSRQKNPETQSLMSIVENVARMSPGGGSSLNLKGLVEFKELLR